MSSDAMNPKGMSQKGISVWVSRYPHDWHRSKDGWSAVELFLLYTERMKLYYPLVN